MGWRTVNGFLRLKKVLSDLPSFVHLFVDLATVEDSQIDELN